MIISESSTQSWSDEAVKDKWPACHHLEHLLQQLTWLTRWVNKWAGMKVMPEIDARKGADI